MIKNLFAKNGLKEKLDNCKENNIVIATLIKKVAQELGDERASKCAYDCLLQENNGQLKETVAAWEGYIVDKKTNNGVTETERNGVWVPAIPL